jgi:hypothetical protein
MLDRTIALGYSGLVADRPGDQGEVRCAGFGALHETCRFGYMHRGWLEGLVRADSLWYAAISVRGLAAGRVVMPYESVWLRCGRKPLAAIAVTVSSQVTKQGSTISGDTTHVVVVKTNPACGPEPGQPGTGTVVAQAC